MFQSRLGLFLEGNLRLKIDWASLYLKGNLFVSVICRKFFLKLALRTSQAAQAHYVIRALNVRILSHVFESMTLRKKKHDHAKY